MSAWNGRKMASSHVELVVVLEQEGPVAGGDLFAQRRVGLDAEDLVFGGLRRRLGFAFLSH